MRIIIEGCDGTGKTTLVNFFKEKLGRNIIKTSEPKTKNPYKEYMLSIFYTQKSNFIYDRFWVGETIYGPIYRGQSGIDKNKESSLLNVTSEDVYIICSTDNKTIKKVFSSRGEDFTKEEDIVKINSEFRKFYSKYEYLGNFFLYDFKKDGKDLEKFYLKIKNRGL